MVKPEVEQIILEVPVTAQEKLQSPPRKIIENEIPQPVIVEEKFVEVIPEKTIVEHVEIESQVTDNAKEESITFTTEDLLSHYLRKIDIVNAHTFGIKGIEEKHTVSQAPQQNFNNITENNVNTNKNFKNTPYSPLTPDISTQFPPYIMIFDPNVQQYVSHPFAVPGYGNQGFAVIILL